jgi:hypothetical protein
MTYGLVACCATKADKACAAKDLYVSPLFRMSRQWIERQGVLWFILSAKYGLLDPSRIVEPYNLTLSQLTRQQRQQWSRHVHQQIVMAVGDATLLVLAGSLYLGATKGFRVIDPLQGLPIGRRLQRLKAMLAA